MSKKQGYSKIFSLLSTHFENNTPISVEDIASSSGLKPSSIKVYIRNRLKNSYLKRRQDGKFDVLDRIKRISSDGFIDWMGQNTVTHAKDEPQWSHLVANANQSMLAAIELHNKPLFNYRYQVVTILVINAWELLLKAYISKYNPTIRLVNEDGTTRPFDKCLGHVSSNLGKDMPELKDNLEVLYNYRCEFVHYYVESLDVLLFGIIYKTILLYHRFSSNYFGDKHTLNDDFVILPIGFKKPLSPIDYITNRSILSSSSPAIKELVADIVQRTKRLASEGTKETIVIPYAFACIDEKHVKNADIVAAITKDEAMSISVTQKVEICSNATRKIRIDEESLFTNIFIYKYSDIFKYCKAGIPGWKQNSQFHAIMKELKKDPKLHKERWLDPNSPKGGKKDFYSADIFDVIKATYTRRTT